MTIKIRLSEEQANAVRAIARSVQVSETNVLLGCATAMWNMQWDDAREFREELLRNLRLADAGQAGGFDSCGRLGCGVVARMPSQRELAARAIGAFFRESARKALNGNGEVPHGVTFDPATGVIHLADGWPRYRWTGRRIARVA